MKAADIFLISFVGTLMMICCFALGHMIGYEQGKNYKDKQ